MKGTKAYRESKDWREDAETNALQDPRDMVKAILLETQSGRLKRWPIATASKSDVFCVGALAFDTHNLSRRATINEIG